MSGVPVAAGVPIALAGAATGLSVTPSAGTLVAPDVWRATCTAIADQTVNAKHFAQATATLQPLVAAGGLINKPSLSFALVNKMVSALVVPGSHIAPLSFYMAFSPATTGGQQIFVGSDSQCTLYSDTGNINRLLMFPPASGVLATALTAAPTRLLANWTFSAADSIKVGGAAPVTGVGAGGLGVSSLGLGGSSGANFFSTMQFYLLVVAPLISPAQMATADVALNSWGAGGFIV